VTTLLLVLLAQDVEVRARAWSARFDGATRADGETGLGTRVDVDELGLDGAEAAGMAELTLRFPGVGRFTLDAWRVGLEGSETLDGNVVYDDVLFPAGTRMDSELEVSVVSLDYGFTLASFDALTIEGEAGLRYVAGHAEVEGGGLTAKANLNRPLLLPGVRVEGTLLPWLSAAADVHAIAFSTANLSLRWLELDLEATARPWRGLRVGLGYRLYRVDAKATEDSTNFDLDGSLHGPYVALGWDF
jgi:hypothetical protein